MHLSPVSYYFTPLASNCLRILINTDPPFKKFSKLVQPEVKPLWSKQPATTETLQETI
jgi:hypothetical protein